MDRRHPARLIRHAAQRTCRRSMRTATAALGTTMSRPSSLAGSHRVSLPISSQGAAKDCALSLTWSGRAAENAGLLKRQHRSRSQRRFPEDALVANVGCRRQAADAAARQLCRQLPQSGRSAMVSGIGGRMEGVTGGLSAEALHHSTGLLAVVTASISLPPARRPSSPSPFPLQRNCGSAPRHRRVRSELPP